MNHLSLIIKREYISKVRNKAFIIMTIVSPVIMIGLICVVAYLSQKNNDKVRVISVLDSSGLVKDVFKDTNKLRYEHITGLSLEEAKALVKATSGYGLLHVKQNSSIEALSKNITFYSADPPPASLVNKLERLLKKRLTEINYKTNGLDMQKIQAYKIDVSIYQENFKGKASFKSDNFVKLMFGGAAGYLLFMFIIIYGNMIMRSVIEEKTSRIIEVIISSVKPVELMLGKIIGTSLAGITQFAIWICIGGVLLSVASVVLGLDLAQLQAPQQAILESTAQTQMLDAESQQIVQGILSLPLLNLTIAFVLFFTCGYFLYSSFYAAIGAAVDNETDTQQFIFPVIIPLILAVYIGFFTVIEEPHGTISTVFSFIPLTSPVVMLMRIPFGVPIWQQITSLIILVVAFMFSVWFAAKIYRIGILMYGKKPSYKELVKWLKY